MLDFYASKPAGYFGNVREEIQRLIPSGTASLLDVGCGEGALARAAKERHRMDYVAGIELFADAAATAAQILDEVHTANIEQFELPFPDKRFDCIICADVLEHMQDPWAVLVKLRRVLADDGVIISSIPNVGNLRVVKKILLDRFEYEPSGLLDKTHLRFFTLHTIRGMFDECGYQIIRTERTVHLNFFLKYSRYWSLGLIKEGDVFQFFTVARKKST